LFFGCPVFLTHELCRHKNTVVMRQDEVVDLNNINLLR